MLEFVEQRQSRRALVPPFDGNDPNGKGSPRQRGMVPFGSA